MALHAGGLPGYPSSHGCVHLPSKFAEELFVASPMGMTVVVVNEHSAPGEVAHPPAFSPVDAATGVPVSAERLAADEEFRLEPEKAPHGPVSILMSSADQRVLVLRNGVEIGRARITVHDPSEPLGTHTFVMREQPDTSAPTWVAVAMPGHFDEDGRALSQDAAARVSMPPGFARAVSLLLAPGATLFVTDAPILAENMHADITVLSDGAPEWRRTSRCSLVASPNNEDRAVFRHLIVAIALLPLIAACSRQQEAPESAAARKPATTAQATSEAQPAEVSFAQVIELQGVTFNVVSPNAASANTVTVSTTGLEIDNSAWSQEVDGIVTGARWPTLTWTGRLRSTCTSSRPAWMRRDRSSPTSRTIENL